MKSFILEFYILDVLFLSFLDFRILSFYMLSTYRLYFCILESLHTLILDLYVFKKLHILDFLIIAFLNIIVPRSYIFETCTFKIWITKSYMSSWFMFPQILEYLAFICFASYI